MFSSAAAFYADATEQLNISSLNEPVWDSSVYCPPIETSSGAYYYNYWEDFCYAPIYYGYQYYPELYQPSVANVYGEFQNDYQTVPYYSQVFYDIYYYPVDVHFVPVIYYPVTYVPVTYYAIDVPYQYYDVHDLSGPNDCQYSTSQNRDRILTDCDAHETASPQCTTLELYYEEDGECLNDAPFNDDDKKENDDNQSASSHSEAMCKEETCSEVIDSDYEDAIFELCSKFEKLSLLDDKEKSLSSKSDENSAEDSSSKSDDTSVEDSPSKSDENSVEDSSRKSDDNSSGDSSSSDSSSSDSSSSDSYEVNDSAIERQGNIMDFHHIEDYSQSAFDTSPWSGDKKNTTEDNSEVESEVHELSGQSYIDMIVSSEEYLYVQDNLKHPKRYKDYLYRKSLENNPRREKNILFDVLPTIEEESTPLMDDMPIESEDNINIEDRVIVPPEMTSSVEDEPVISEIKQPKRRFKAFKKWLSRTFCCCCTTKDPP